MKKKRTGGEAVVETLADLGVRHVFGIPGVHNLGIYDALLEHASAGRPPAHILVRHEQSAVYAADGFARATGKPGVAIATTGPGSLNAMAALNEAACAGVPVLLLASQIHSGLLGAGRKALHETKDQVGAFRAVADHGESVLRPEEIPVRITEAFGWLARGPGRTVFLEIPHDFLTAVCETQNAKLSTPPVPRPSVESMQAALSALEAARHPALVVGGGVVHAAAEDPARRLAEWLGAPVITTSAAKGVLPADHPLHVGVLAAGASIDTILSSADLLLALGTRLGHRDLRRVQSPPPRTVIHVDTDPSAFNRTWQASIAVEADAEAFLEELFEGIRGKAPRERPDVRDRVREVVDLQNRRNRELDPLAMDFLAALTEGLGDEGILSADQTVMGYWCELYYPCRRSRTFLYPSGSGVLGYALPAALGAKAALPDRRVAVVIGDGGFHFSSAEFGTMVQYRQGIPIVIFNDEQYGVIRYLQERTFGRSGEVDLLNPDFPALARAYGGEGLRVSDPASLPGALRDGFARDVPTLIEVPASLKPPW